MKQVITTIGLVLLGVAIFVIVVGTNPNSLKSKVDSFYGDTQSHMTTEIEEGIANKADF